MDSKAQAEKGVNIGIGEYRMDSSLLTSIGLGSCVAVVIHDNRKNVGAVAHVMLPDSNGRNDRPGKFADTAVPTLYNLLIDGGSNKRDLIAKIAGGSSMFKQFKGNLDIGQRNVEAVKEALTKVHVVLVAEDVGGTCGRSIIYNPSESATVHVRRADGTCTDI